MEGEESPPSYTEFENTDVLSPSFTDLGFTEFEKFENKDLGLSPSYTEFENKDIGLSPSYTEFENKDLGLSPGYTEFENTDIGLSPSCTEFENKDLGLSPIYTEFEENTDLGFPSSLSSKIKILV
ncbi:hypothetical protein CEXT_615541 [Caerostris extrusa]|uniref:Uncharacterized protein n=1 Tax=Caerostris extrusa TaxID=172846 RepID=A0AAV4QWS2_CAEEX|nr:hypothetical protein CEXT_615541 [Caerostris extrusa]